MGIGRSVSGAAFIIVSLGVGVAASAAPLYFNGFETNTAGWYNTTQVASGTNSIASATGSFHAMPAAGNTYTDFGGYNYGAGNAVPTSFQEYYTSIDIYLNVGGGFANDTRFDFSSAINNSAGTHRRDFIFNAGFYNDGTGPGANTNRFVISASNNSSPGSAFPKNPAKNPIAISTTGWYTFEHHFYDNGGVLAVDMSIFDASDALVNTWTLSDATDLISGIGGNRYGWFDNKQLTPLAFDNSELRLANRAVPEPGSLALLGLALTCLAASRRRKQ